MCMFAQHLYRESKKPGTVENYVSSVRVLHRLAELQAPEANNIHYQMLVNGLKRECKKPLKQATPMDHENLLKIFVHVDFSSELEAVAWVAVLIGFNLVLRVSNLGPLTRTKFNAEQNLCRSDVQVLKGYITIGIRWSKTNQYKNRTQFAPLIPQEQKIVCPEFRIKRMIKNVPVEPYEPLFLVREKQDRLPLSSAQINRLLKKWCKAAQIDHKVFMPHCSHRGGLNWAHDAEVSGESLMVMGDWKSNVYRDYLNLDLESRIKTGKCMAEHLSKM